MSKKSHVRIDITSDDRELGHAVSAVVADAMKEVLPSTHLELHSPLSTNPVSESRTEIRDRLIKAAKNIEAVRMYNADLPADMDLLAVPAGLHTFVLSSASDVPPLDAVSGDTVCSVKVEATCN